MPSAQLGNRAAGAATDLVRRAVEAHAVLDPHPCEVVASYPTGDAATIEAAIPAAAGAFRQWTDRSVIERASVVRRIAELHFERSEELGQIITREMGKPLEEAVGE